MDKEKKDFEKKEHVTDAETHNTADSYMKVLLVDDDETILMTLAKFLEDDGIDNRTADNASDAFRIAYEYKPDIIVSDVEMPDEKGTDLLKKIRNTPELNEVIFILSSGQKIQSKDAAFGLYVGADDYILKPVRKEEFIARIHSFYRIKSLQDKLRYSNKKLEKALIYAKSYKRELEKQNSKLENEKKLLENSLKQISLMAEERERTNKELKVVNRERESDLNSIIKLLAKVIDARRKHRRGHAKKVSEISVFIAEELRLPAQEIKQIEIAALLHEIGLLSISDAFAAKQPEEYNEQDLQFLVNHPVSGALLLEDFTYFKEIAKIIRHYHECSDGSGVPDGLKRDAIPIGSRIIAIADRYDIMVYRNPNSRTLGIIDVALSKIENDVGVKYDPKVFHVLHKYANLNPVEESDKTRELKIYELEPGMKLASGIFTEKGAKLLPKNTVLTEENISRIVQYSKSETLEETVFVKI